MAIYMTFSPARQSAMSNNSVTSSSAAPQHSASGRQVRDQGKGA